MAEITKNFFKRTFMRLPVEVNLSGLQINLRSKGHSKVARTCRLRIRVKVLTWRTIYFVF
jgi:hypothetical protein